MHSFFLTPKPQSKSAYVTFRTYHSLQTKRKDQTEKSKPKFNTRTSLKRQIYMIQAMNNKTWLKDSEQIQDPHKNMPDLIELIKKQKSEQPQWERVHSKRMKARTNSFCIKNEGNISIVAASLADQYTLNNRLASQRSNILEYSDQPTRVKLFKKLAIYRNQILNKLGQQRQYSKIINDGLLGETFRKNRKSPCLFNDDINQRSTLSKQTNQECDLQSIKTDKIACINRLQSMLCKGEILSKENQFSRRKRCIKKMSIIEKELQSRSKQPVFLLQI